MNVVVLVGGNNSEQDISIISGKNICIALRKKKYNAILLDVCIGKTILPKKIFSNIYDINKELNYIKSKNNKLKNIMKNRKNFFGPNVLKICKLSDIVFLALHGGNGENGKIQATFDLIGIRYTGTNFLSSSLAMNKDITKMLFNANNIPTPKFIIVKKNEYKYYNYDKLSDYNINFPIIIKPCCEGSSIGVNIIKNNKNYINILKQLFKYYNKIIIENFIYGREFSIAVIDNKIYPIIEIIVSNDFYSYKKKYKSKNTKEICPAKLKKNIVNSIKKYVKHIYNLLSLQVYARFDFILDKNNNIYFLEINTLPGMTKTSLLPKEAKSLNIDYCELCEKIIKLSLKKY